jgi:subtilisin family serine protease
MTQRARLLILSILLLSASMPAFGGVLSPALDSRLADLPPGQKIGVLIVLNEQAPVAELTRALSDRDANRAERHETIVRALQAATASQRDLLDALEGELRAGRVDGYRSYWIVNAVVVSADEEAVRTLVTRPDVMQIRENPHPDLIAPIGTRDATENLRGIGVPPGQRAIQTDRVWRELGITGRGRLVANIDTGVDGLHPALQERWRGNNGHPWQECWLDVLGGDTQYPEDSAQHGTHVMGTITGLGAATGDTIGGAWGAQWIACNAIGQGAGGDFDNDILTAFQWLADPDGNPATVSDVPDVVQNSWGVREIWGYPACWDYWWQVIDNCEAAGCCVTWSAGNEGPGPMSLRIPAERSTTPTNIAAVGAVDATNYGWPYPIADFSSRGPSDCPGAAIKPEIAAPGVDVYSSVPGGNYAQSGWSGTSMAGPHVAGVVALMGEANPDLDVQTIKQIIMDTARDEGTPGEDNDYGWGLIDAYAAVSQALAGTGVLEGTIVNSSFGNAPIPEARVSLRNSAAQYPTDANGFYRGHALGGAYMAVATHSSFAPESSLVTITAGGTTVQAFALRDVAGPAISGVSDPGTIPDATGPYPIQATMTDFSAVQQGTVWYRVNGDAWLAAGMSGEGSLYTGQVPGQTAGSRIDFYIEGVDIAANASTFPADAPNSYRTFVVTTPILIDDAEAALGWSLSWLGDTGTAGFWVREDPVGTTHSGNPAQPEDDHTTDPGHICFATGNGTPGGGAGAADVDGGCVSLVSPTLDLVGMEGSYVYLWRWFFQSGLGGDNWSLQVSNNNGLTWVDIEVLTARQNTWTPLTIHLETYVPLTAVMRLRVKVCDLGIDSVVEGALDDIRIEGLPPIPAAADEISGPSPLANAQPNPMRSQTKIAFRVSTPCDVSLQIYDATGRRVRSLASGTFPAGAHEIEWNGQDDGGSDLPPGVYFYRLRTGGTEQSSRIVRTP